MQCIEFNSADLPLNQSPPQESVLRLIDAVVYTQLSLPWVAHTSTVCQVTLNALYPGTTINKQGKNTNLNTERKVILKQWMTFLWNSHKWSREGLSYFQCVFWEKEKFINVRVLHNESTLDMLPIQRLQSFLKTQFHFPENGWRSVLKMGFFSMNKYFQKLLHINYRYKIYVSKNIFKSIIYFRLSAEKILLYYIPSVAQYIHVRHKYVVFTITLLWRGWVLKTKITLLGGPIENMVFSGLQSD